MNLKRKVLEYLEKNPNATNTELRKEFPQASKKSLWNYSGQWKKQKGFENKGNIKSVRKQVFGYFDKNPLASLKDLKEAFPDANTVSISNYRYQWKKQKSNLGKKVSIKDQVYNFLQKNPKATFGELRNALSHIKPSSVSAYHSQWKKRSQEKAKPGRPKLIKSEKTGKKPKTKTTPQDNEKELVKALQATIEAQKVTIEAMKTQNSLLKEKQSAVMHELEGLSDIQLDELKRIMSTYIKGMRKL
jgi:predicted transcriptional regulator